MSYSPNRPTKERSINREKIAWELRVKGWSQDKIADALQVSQAAVSKMLAKSTKKYSAAYLSEIKNIKDEQVAQLEYVAHQAIAAWESSRNQSDGDSRYLQAYMQAKSDIRKIVGADSPSVTRNLNVDITQFSDEELNDIINGKYFK